MVFLRSLDNDELQRRMALPYLLNSWFANFEISMGWKIDSKISVIVDNFYVVPIDIKTMFIKSRLPIFPLENHNFRFLWIHQ